MIVIFIIICAVCTMIVYYSRNAEPPESSTRISRFRQSRGITETKPDHVLTEQEIAEAKEKEIRLTLYAFSVKISITHLQILGFSGNFAKVWPDVLLRVFALPASAASTGAATDNITIDCIFNPSIYSKGALNFILPLIIIFLVTLGELLHSAKKAFASRRSSSANDESATTVANILSSAARQMDRKFFSRVRQGVVILLYVAHPGIVEKCFKILVCYDVGIQSYAAVDMRVNCASDGYQSLFWLDTLFLCFYGFGLLIFVYFAMQRWPLDFTFLSGSYKDEYFYWEIVVTVEKLILVVISLNASTAMQLFLSMWVLLICWLLHHNARPLLSDHAHLLQTVSLWVLTLTVSIGGLFFNGVIPANSQASFGVTLFLILLNFFTLVSFFNQSLYSKLVEITRAKTNKLIDDVHHFSDEHFHFHHQPAETTHGHQVEMKVLGTASSGTGISGGDGGNDQQKE
jgi:hypothetical protein